MQLPYPDSPDPLRLFEWAKKLVQQLDRPATLEQLVLPGRALAALSAPERDGVVIFVKDATGGGVPVYSRDGEWLRFDTGDPVA